MNEMNTLADLREIVAHKIDEAICGREIDIHENSIVLPEMLGIVEIGETATYKDIDDSILSPTHTVWDDWHSDISSEYEAREKVQAAITSLKNKGILELPYLYEDKLIIICYVIKVLEKLFMLIVIHVGIQQLEQYRILRMETRIK